MMEISLEKLYLKVENLTTEVNSAIALEALHRESADLERNKILNELNELKQLIRTKGRGTVAQQAERLGLVLGEPNRKRGQYFGTVVGLDYRASLMKYANTRAFEVPLNAFADGASRPTMGDSFQIGFNEGVISLRMAERMTRRRTSEET